MLTGLRWIKFYQHVSQYHGLVIMSIHILTIKFGTLQISMFRMIRMDNLGIKSLFIYYIIIKVGIILIFLGDIQHQGMMDSFIKNYRTG